jgi:hypothetical protein
MAENETSVLPASSRPSLSADTPAPPSGPAEVLQEPGRLDSATDLRSLVGHTLSLAADTPLETVQQFFSSHVVEFVAALEGGRPVGLCARRQVGILLGSRFGFSLFARNPARQHLLPEALIISVTDSIHDVLARVSARPDEYFFDDLLLVDETGVFLGALLVRNLVRLQQSLLWENLRQLEKKGLEIERKNNQIEQELNLAGKVQQAMLPQVYPTFSTPSASSILRFHHRYLPAGRISGDFFHVRRISDRQAGVFICDVMGHGVRSAMITAAMRALVEAARAFGDSQEFEDDVCLLAIDITPFD